MAIGPGWGILPVPFNYGIPTEWDHVVCICPDDHGTKHCADENCIYMHCRQCDKLKRFYGSFCRNCKQFYLMVFKCENWNPRINWCWDCLASPLDGLHLPPSPRKCVPPPEWAKPRAIRSTEEIAADLDDFLADW